MNKINNYYRVLLVICLILVASVYSAGCIQKTPPQSEPQTVAPPQPTETIRSSISVKEITGELLYFKQYERNLAATDHRLDMLKTTGWFVGFMSPGTQFQQVTYFDSHNRDRLNMYVSVVDTPITIVEGGRNLPLNYGFTSIPLNSQKGENTIRVYEVSIEYGALAGLGQGTELFFDAGTNNRFTINMGGYDNRFY